MSASSSISHSSRLWRGVGRWLVFTLFFTCFGVFYVSTGTRLVEDAALRPLRPLEQRHLALAQASRRDQMPDFSRSISEPLNLWLPHRTDGFVQPLWPWIAAWMLDPQDTDASGNLVRRAGAFRIAMTLSFLLVIGIICVRSFSLPAAILVVLMIGAHGMLPTLEEFGGGTLYGTLLLLIWPAFIFGLQRNSLWVYGVIGIFGTLAYLTDERVLPVLAAFVLISTLRAAWGGLAALWHRQAPPTLWVRRNHVFGLLLLGIMFVFIAGPRLVASQQSFGSPLHSHWRNLRWLDDADAAAAWLRGDAAPSLSTTALIPAARNLNWGSYSATHSRGAIVGRLRHGFEQLLHQCLRRGGAYLIALLVLLAGAWAAVLLIAPKAHHAWHRLHPETATVALFVVVAVIAYAVMAAWDAAVINVDHALLPLHSALALSLVWACESLLRRARRRGARRIVYASYQAALGVILAVAAWQVIQMLQPVVSVS